MEHISPSMLHCHTFPLPSDLLADSEGTRGVDVNNNFFGAVLVVIVLDLFKVVVVMSGWLDLKDECCISRIDPKSMVTGLSVLRSSCNVVNDLYVHTNEFVRQHTQICTYLYACRQTNRKIDG